MCLQVLTQEQSHAAAVALWATAVAAADGVHSSKQVQEGLIGACSAIRCPWPALPTLLETALPGQPVERVLPCYCPLPCAYIQSRHDCHRVHWQTYLWKCAPAPNRICKAPCCQSKAADIVPDSNVGLIGTAMLCRLGVLYMPAWALSTCQHLCQSSRSKQIQ